MDSLRNSAMRQVPLEYPNPELWSPAVHMRKWSFGDLACVEAASKTEIPKGTTVPARYTPQEGREWIERQWGRQTSGQGLSLAIADAESSQARGLVYLGLDRDVGHCRIGYWLVPAARRQGLGTAAIRIVSRWVLTETHVYRLVAHVEPSNAASLGLLRKCGFTEEGLLRSFLRFDDGLFDAISMSLIEQDLD